MVVGDIENNRKKMIYIIHYTLTLSIMYTYVYKTYHYNNIMIEVANENQSPRNNKVLFFYLQ